MVVFGGVLRLAAGGQKCEARYGDQFSEKPSVVRMIGIQKLCESDDGKVLF